MYEQLEPDYGVVQRARKCKCYGRSEEQAEFRRARSGMPFVFLDKRASDFDWSRYKANVEVVKKVANKMCVDFRKFQEAGKGIYLYSKTKGSGKTMLACCLMNELIARYGISAKFTTVPDYLALVSEEFKLERGAESEVKHIIDSQLLILDDIGNVKASDWSDSNLYRLLDTRMSKKRVTIFTSNVTMEKLNVDDRIQDRIFKMALPLEMPEESIRFQDAEKEHENFLKTILQ